MPCTANAAISLFSVYAGKMGRGHRVSPDGKVGAVGDFDNWEIGIGLAVFDCCGDLQANDHFQRPAPEERPDAPATASASSRRVDKSVDGKGYGKATVFD